MIFNCPECKAGHSVPVSMIPNGGLDMDCRRCGEAFTIEPPGDDHKIEDTADEPLPDGLDLSDTGDVPGEKTSVGPAPIPVEETRVGVANPLEFEEEPPLIGPGGIEYRSDEPSSDGETERKKRAWEENTPELDETIRFNQTRSDSIPSPSVTEPGVIEPSEESDVSELSGLEVSPLSSTSDSSPSVYERIAAGIPVPEEQKAARPPSEARQPVEERRSIFQPVIDLLNGAPLALKVGLIVFPVTLGVMLVINSMREEVAPPDAPIEIPIAVEEAAAPKPKDPPPEPPKEEVKETKPAVEAPPPPPPPDERPEIDDAPAPDGFAYVQIEDAKLRVRAVDKSGIAGRVQIGGLVKVYDDVGEFSLVASMPDGPAGFLSKKLLGPRKPLALLARDQAFERCSAEEGSSVDDCLFAAKQQEQPCLDRCGAVNAGNEAERLRCAEVCSIAFETCARSCRLGGPKIAKGKRRRR